MMRKSHTREKVEYGLGNMEAENVGTRRLGKGY